MASRKKFSSSIVLFLVLFMGVSLVFIASIVYFTRSHNSMKKALVRFEERKVALAKVLKENTDYLQQAAGELASIPEIAEYYQNGNADSLQLLIEENLPPVQGAHITIYDDRTGRFFPDIADTVTGIKDYLETYEGAEKIIRQVGENTVFVCSTPVADTSGEIGTCFLVYSFTQDSVFRSIVQSSEMRDPQVIFHDMGGLLFDVETGEQFALSQESYAPGEPGRPEPLPVELFPETIMLPLDHFGGLYFAGSIRPIIEENRAFLVDLVYLCMAIFFLICLASVLLSKMVAKPLEILAAEAFETAQAPTGRFLREERAGYLEFSQIARAFNQVLANLLDLQKQFKLKAKKELDASEERYRLTLEAAPDAIIINSLKDGRFIQINEAFVSITGYSRDETIGKTIADLKLLADISDLPRIVDAVRYKGAANGVEIRHRRKDGTIIDTVVSARKVDFGGEDCLISVVSDRTAQKKAAEEQKKLEAALQRASKMEAIGTMAGGVAHDLNNILSGIVSYPELLLLELPEDSPLRRSILTIQKSGQKAAAIVQDMLTLARRGVQVRNVVNINDIVLEYLKSPEHGSLRSHHPSVRVTTDIEPELMGIIGSNLHISKSLMNLVNNAFEAMPEGGEIRIETRNQYVDKPAPGYDAFKEGDYVVLTVSDNGVGIAAEDKERIFEPFYTKKEMGKSGTGLGMAVVWGTVKDHGGYIDLQSSEGQGTEFQLYFPATRKTVLKDKPEILIEEYRGSGESVLVVDDVAEQRHIASDILEHLGYEVASVASGEEALTYLKKKPADLIVLDMIMDPGMDGLETYRKILELNPDQKAIVASGFSETGRAGEAQRLGVGSYVKKPYTMLNIGLAVRNELLKDRGGAKANQHRTEGHP